MTEKQKLKNSLVYHSVLSRMYDKGNVFFSRSRHTARVYLSANQTCLECTAQVKFP